MCHERYENIYRSIWSQFNYAAAISAGFITFAAGKISPAGILLVICLVSLFWFWATFDPLNRYADVIAERAAGLEKQLGSGQGHYSIFNAERSKSSDGGSSCRQLGFILFLIALWHAIRFWISWCHAPEVWLILPAAIFAVVGLVVIVWDTVAPSPNADKTKESSDAWQAMLPWLKALATFVVVGQVASFIYLMHSYTPDNSVELLGVGPLGPHIAVRPFEIPWVYIFQIGTFVPLASVALTLCMHRERIERGVRTPVRIAASVALVLFTLSLGYNVRKREQRDAYTVPIVSEYIMKQQA